MSEWSNLKFKIVNLQLELDAANNGREFAAMRANRLQKEIENLEQQLATARREADESAKDAFRRGWEQCQKTAIIKTMEHHQDFMFGSSIPTVCQDIAYAIAAMEYKEDNND